MKNQTFDQIYKQYNAQVLSFTNLILNNFHDAEEVTSETFVKAWQAIEEGKFDESKSSLRTWLYNIAKRTAIDFHRTAHKDKYISISDFNDAETGLEQFQFVDDSADQNDSNELSLKITEALNSLKPKYKKVAELYFIQDKPYKEIAIILDVPLGTVQGMIYRVREMLQTSLKQYATA